MAKEKVLVVDDEPDVLDLCERILQTQGYSVKTASNGFDAIATANTEHFDLLLTDIRMPDMTGLEIAQSLKESDPGIICVTMTGYATMDSAIQALSLGIDEFILKPFTPNDLGAAIAKALEKERLRKENFRLRSLIPLFELNKTLMGTVEVEDVLNRLIEIAVQETRAKLAGLYTLKDSQLTARHYTADGSDCTEAQKQACQQLANICFEDGAQLLLSRNRAGQNYQALVDRLQAASVIATPLKSKNSNLGVLVLAHTENFAPSDNEFLSVLCGQASIALENAHAYEQLQILDHLKSEFINIAAHELRTPLSILIGYASILEEEISDTQRDFVSNIMRNALRLRSLMEDMLNLKKLESGIIDVTQDTVNLREAVEEITQDLILLTDKKHQIYINVPADFPQMIVDRQKFELIMVNLIDNAIKFTPPEGKITFNARVENSHAKMSLTNTGITIPQKEHDKIFERFYQVEESLIREHGGAGLGLAIARGMLEVCGGEISVDSSEETGTTFTFTLPLDNTGLKGGKLQL